MCVGEEGGVMAPVSCCIDMAAARSFGVFIELVWRYVGEAGGLLTVLAS
jgi:hypothetical protein